LVLPVVIKGTTYRINVMVRPGTEEFLARMGELYEVVVFTASLSEYAEPLVKALDPTNVISYLLFRQHCTPLNGIYVKDLSLLGRDMRNIILVDNSPNSFLFQPQNAYHISNFFDDKSDRDLYKLAYFLENITHLSDVRPIEDYRRKYDPPHYTSSAHMKFVKVQNQNSSVADQEQDQDYQSQDEEPEEEQDPDYGVDLEHISVVKANYPAKANPNKKEDREKVYNVETEPDLGREGRGEEFPKTIISERNKDKAGMYPNYYSKAGPLTERIVVNDRLVPQALDSSVDFELPSPKESDALINHREADAFFENNTNSSDSKDSKAKPKIPPFPKSSVSVFTSSNLVAMNDPTLEGHKVEDVRFLTGIENLNSPLGKHVKIDLTNQMEASC
jgi:Dullard-like phosphatase family protein